MKNKKVDLSKIQLSKNDLIISDYNYIINLLTDLGTIYKVLVNNKEINYDRGYFIVLDFFINKFKEVLNEKEKC